MGGRSILVSIAKKNTRAHRLTQLILPLVTKGFSVLFRFLWNLLTILLTGGDFGAHVKKDFGTYYHSDHWKKIREVAIEHAHGKCAVCGYDYQDHGKKLLVRHTRKYNEEGKSVYGREDAAKDLICLCEKHIGSTPYRKKEYFASWRAAYTYYRPLQR